jgi:hypothetical protein
MSAFSILTERIFHSYRADFPFLLRGFSIFPKRFYWVDILILQSGHFSLVSELYNFTERILPILVSGFSIFTERIFPF